MFFRRKPKQYEVPAYKDVNGIRIFEKDYKVPTAQWVGERIDCGSIVIFNERSRYLYIKAYALVPEANQALNKYYWTVADTDKYYIMSGISNVTSLGARLDMTGVNNTD